MSTIKLSYVITTYNKLPYLKEVMRLLLLNKKEDEEIVIADGGSSDGTVEFLDGLFREGKIDQFISEKDKGEAHGYNKTFLMARGELIKIITDDDVFNYAAIQQMKAFMLLNPDFDAMTGNIISINIMENLAFFELRKSYEIWFRKFTRGELNSCFFSCLPLMIRRSKLVLIGLLDTSYKHVDLEYSVRLTSQKRKLAFYTDVVAIGLVNQQSVSASKDAVLLVEKAQKRLKGNYGFEDQRGIKSVSIPWIKSNLIDRFSLAKRIVNKLKLFKTRIEYYPHLDYNIKEFYDVPNLTLDKTFQLIEIELDTMPKIDYEFIHN